MKKNKKKEANPSKNRSRQPAYRLVWPMQVCSESLCTQKGNSKRSLSGWKTASLRWTKTTSPQEGTQMSSTWLGALTLFFWSKVASAPTSWWPLLSIRVAAEVLHCKNIVVWAFFCDLFGISVFWKCTPVFQELIPGFLGTASVGFAVGHTPKSPFASRQILSNTAWSKTCAWQSHRWVFSQWY